MTSILGCPVKIDQAVVDAAAEQGTFAAEMDRKYRPEFTESDITARIAQSGSAAAAALAQNKAFGKSGYGRNATRNIQKQRVYNAHYQAALEAFEFSYREAYQDTDRKAIAVGKAVTFKVDRNKLDITRDCGEWQPGNPRSLGLLLLNEILSDVDEDDEIGDSAENNLALLAFEQALDYRLGDAVLCLLGQDDQSEWVIEIDAHGEIWCAEQKL